MSAPESNGGSRINVSEDKLDSKLARLELSLVDRITKALDVKADQAYVEQLHARIHTAESSVAAASLLIAASKTTSDDLEQRVRVLEKFRYAIPSAALLSAAGAIAAALFAYLR